jgi:hypothetical protein
MIYKFKSPAAGDLVMLGPHGDQLLRLMGREPAPRGIFEPAAMPGLIETLHRAVASDEAQRAAAAAAPAEGDAREEDPARPAVGLRQRVWPMVQMLERAHAEGQPIVWGV